MQVTCQVRAIQMQSHQASFQDSKLLFFQVPGKSYCKRFFLSSLGSFLIQLILAMHKHFLKEFFSCCSAILQHQNPDSLSFRYYGFPSIKKRRPNLNSFPRHNFCTCKAFKVIAELAEPALPEIFHSHKARSFGHGLVQRMLRQLLEVVTLSVLKNTFVSVMKNISCQIIHSDQQKKGKVFSYGNSATTGSVPTLTFQGKIS